MTYVLISKASYLGGAAGTFLDETFRHKNVDRFSNGGLREFKELGVFYLDDFLSRSKAATDNLLPKVGGKVVLHKKKVCLRVFYSERWRAHVFLF